MLFRSRAKGLPCGSGQTACVKNILKNQYTPKGTLYCKKYSGYKRHKNVKNLEQCKKVCDGDPTCNAIAHGKYCITYKNCNISNKTQKWGFKYWMKEPKKVSNRYVSLGNVRCNKFKSYKRYKF